MAQGYATTGYRNRRNYTEEMRSRLPFLAEMMARKDADKYRADTLALKEEELALQKAANEQQEKQNTMSSALAKTSVEDAKRQNKTANLINLLGLGTRTGLGLAQNAENNKLVASLKNIGGKTTSVGGDLGGSSSITPATPGFSGALSSMVPKGLSGMLGLAGSAGLGYGAGRFLKGESDLTRSLIGGLAGAVLPAGFQMLTSSEPTNWLKTGVNFLAGGLGGFFGG